MLSSGYTKLLETIIVPSMLLLGLEVCEKEGIAIRRDLVLKLNAEILKHFVGVDKAVAAGAAKEIHDKAKCVMGVVKHSESVKLLYACAMFCLVLVSEGLIQDIERQSVLVSMLLIEDAKIDMASEDATDLIVRDLTLQDLETQAKLMLTRARLMGLFSGLGLFN